MRMSSKKVSVVIGSYNRNRLLQLCIDAVRDELRGIDYEIIVVDGGSTDGAIEWLTCQKDIISIVQHNRGTWAGKPIERKPWAYFMNLAFKAASGKFVCMLSDDSLVIPGAIKNGLNVFEECLERQEKIGAVAFFFRDYPLRKKYAVAINIGNLYVNHGLFLNAAMQEVGYCDENYHFYFADSDLCMKLRQAGYDVITSEASFVEHFFEATPEIRASNNDARKNSDRNRLISKWAGVGYPEDKRAVYQNLVGYWREHETGFDDPANTIQRLIDVCQKQPLTTETSTPKVLSATRKTHETGHEGPSNRPLSSPHRETGSPIPFLLDEMLWEEILYADRFVLEDMDCEQKRKQRDIWMADFLRSDYYFPQAGCTGAVFFRSMVRDDYKQLFHAVIDASGISNRIVLEEYQRTPGRAPLSVDAQKFMINNRELLKRIPAENQLDRSCLFVRACKYAYVLRFLRQIDFKLLVCFADMQPVEHLATRFFREQGLPTVTLQHGLYIDYGEMNTVNRINYLHQPSDYFLSWGPNTSRLIKRHHSNRKVSECGKPVVFEVNSTKNDELSVPYILIFLDQKIFDRQNEEMLSIAADYARRSGHALRVRFHPSINKAQFLKRFPMITEQLHFGDADFVVGHTSSLIYEALTLGKRVMRYATEIPALDLPECCTFTSLEELGQRVKLPQPKGLEDEFFCATGENSQARYASFFRLQFPDLSDRDPVKMKGRLR